MSISAKRRRKHHLSEKTKEKLRIAHLGKKLSAEARAKISAKAKGRPGVWKGKHLNDATKAKISATLTGTHLAEETKCKISKSLRGKPKTAEENEKNRQAHLGKRHSEDAKKKMSEARKKYFEQKRNLQCKN